jgi:hypothetical protein
MNLRKIKVTAMFLTLMMLVTSMQICVQAAGIVRPLASSTDSEPPVISNIKLEETNSSGYTISCTITDNNLINKVYFETKAGNETTAVTDVFGTNINSSSVNAQITVKTSDHNKSMGPYTTRIYATDVQGNVAVSELPYTIYIVTANTTTTVKAETTTETTTKSTTKATTETTTKSTTKATTETTTKSTTKSTAATTTTKKETTTETTTKDTSGNNTSTGNSTVLFGDANNDKLLSASDAATILQKVLDNSFTTGLEKAGLDYMKYLDVDCNEKLTSADSAVVLEKTLNNSYEMPAEAKYN